VFVMLVFALGAVLLWPLIRAWARRIEGRTDQALQRQVDELEQRVSELSQREYRMAELEERLDFAERLLAQREPAALPRKAED
jgi:Tfp pilus assembly protein PilN